MSIDLTQFEQGLPLGGDEAAALAGVQARLASLQTRQIVHGKRALIVLDGWAGSGKKGALKRLVAALDPCHVAVHCGDDSREEGAQRHWLSRFWSALPRGGETAVIYNSWHHQLVSRVIAGQADVTAAARGADAINEFENQQHEHGTIVVKLFFHVSAEVQGKRLRARQADEWRRWMVGPDDLASLAERPGADAAWQSHFAQTDTRWSPWTMIDGANKRAARVRALEAIASALAKAVPEVPPVMSETVGA